MSAEKLCLILCNFVVRENKNRAAGAARKMDILCREYQPASASTRSVPRPFTWFSSMSVYRA